MAEDKRDVTQQNLRAARPASAPPQFLFWLVIGLFAIAITAAITGYLAYRGEGRLVALVPVGLAVVVLVPLLTIALAIIFRRTLPRAFALWLLLAFVILAIIGAFVGIGYYRDQLPPRYQTELITPLPFLRAFLPPTPVGGSVPTVIAPTGGPSALDLLLSDASATPEATAEPSATPTDRPPSATPTQQPATPTPEAEATLDPPTVEPTEVSVLPTTPPPTATPGSAAASAAFNLPVSAYNGGFRYDRQGWNNCGPANAAMVLSYYGWQGTQDDAAAYLKPDREDKNVSPGEIVRFINEQSFVRGLTRVGGDMNMIKAFVSAGFPVIVEVGGLLYEGDNWVGHYRTVVGYDDSQQVMLIYDTWLGIGDGNGITVSYDEFDSTWQPFNRIFIVVYEPDRESDVVRILGNLADVNLAAEHALEVAREEARTDPQNPFVWFNIGASLARLGRYDEAQHAFDEATRLRLPFRMLW
ncbi:MAG: C39 family peptidase, partial [Anaerolineae bacterium]|nr:C39 family peptidase [Anaerolineae bacterium]